MKRSHETWANMLRLSGEREFHVLRNLVLTMNTLTIKFPALEWNFDILVEGLVRKFQCKFVAQWDNSGGFRLGSAALRITILWFVCINSRFGQLLLKGYKRPQFEPCPINFLQEIDSQRIYCHTNSIWGQKFKELETSSSSCNLRINER